MVKVCRNYVDGCPFIGGNSIVCTDNVIVDSDDGNKSYNGGGFVCTQRKDTDVCGWYPIQDYDFVPVQHTPKGVKRSTFGRQ